jgi:hypothetical protein
MNRRTAFRILFLAVLVLTVPAATAQSLGRVTVRGILQNVESGTAQRDFSEVTVSLDLHSPAQTAGHFEYEIDARTSTYPSTPERDARNRIHDAWLGLRTARGALTLRAGQMWLSDLGGIGSVGGAMLEYRRPMRTSPAMLRAGLFGGAEPRNFVAGFEPGIRKGGAWIAWDGPALRRHVLGYVNVRHEGLTERSVVTTTNIVPVGAKLLFYQAGEYDVSGPGGSGSGGINYFFANARYTPVRRFDVTASAHRGRAIDARTITEDILAGRAVDQRALEGFLFESAGVRTTFEVARNVRLHAGYSRDRNNRDDATAGRISAGLWAANVAGTGFDITISDNRIDHPERSYDAIYASIGRSAGARLYLSADYSTSLAVIRLAGEDGAVVERRPRTKRYGFSGVWHATRSVSAVAGLERFVDETTTDERASLSTVYRF